MSESKELIFFAPSAVFAKSSFRDAYTILEPICFTNEIGNSFLCTSTKMSPFASLSW